MNDDDIREAAQRYGYSAIDAERAIELCRDDDERAYYEDAGYKALFRAVHPEEVRPVRFGERVTRV